MSAEPLNNRIDRPTTAPEPLNNLISESLMRKIVKLGYPNGGTGECVMCGKEREYTYEQVVSLLRKSLPKHCDRTIELRSK